MSRYGLFGKISALPGERDALLALLLEAANRGAEMPGCEVYIVSTAPDDPDGIWVMEVWRSEADHAASLQLDSVQALITRARPLIAGMSDRVTLEPIGGKGLTS